MTNQIQNQKQTLRQTLKNPEILHFRTPEVFATYLQNRSAPTWFTKVCVHHTAIPTVVQWRGLSTMQNMLYYYRRLGWTSFPHIFVAPDGVWQMNNVLLRGTHANAANAFSIGVEVVGNYDTGVWQEPICTYAVETIQLLLQWRSLNNQDIVFHRSYNPSKSCPGRAITFPWVQEQLNNTTSENRTYKVITDHARIRQGPATSYPIAGKLMSGDMFISSAVKEDETGMHIGGKNTWAHITKTIKAPNNVDSLGFVHTSLLEQIG